MKINYLILIVVMIFLSITIPLVSYDKAVTMEQGVKTVNQIPLRIGDWHGTDHTLDQLAYDILETKAILHRSYRNSQGREIFLSLVYYAETKVDFHAPEGCLGGQGVKTEKTPMTINITNASGGTTSLKINKLIQKQDNRNTVVYYFYKTGFFVGRNYIKLRLNLVLNKFKEAKKSGSLIRVSTTDNGKESQKELENFLSSLFPYLMEFI
ncbi:MAG: EpsI family protein [Bacteroidetes bacterium]|nr:EpsI family protein [Bacteroidota bacterium]